MKIGVFAGGERLAVVVLAVPDDLVLAGRPGRPGDREDHVLLVDLLAGLVGACTSASGRGATGTARRPPSRPRASGSGPGTRPCPRPRPPRTAGGSRPASASGWLISKLTTSSNSLPHGRRPRGLGRRRRPSRRAASAAMAAGSSARRQPATAAAARSGASRRSASTRPSLVDDQALDARAATRPGAGSPRARARCRSSPGRRRRPTARR